MGGDDYLPDGCGVHDAEPEYEQAQCPACGGEGQVTQTRRVTKAMATDACAPEMEGMPIPDTYQCQQCNGEGAIIEEVKS